MDLKQERFALQLAVQSGPGPLHDHLISQVSDRTLAILAGRLVATDTIVSRLAAMPARLLTDTVEYIEDPQLLAAVHRTDTRVTVRRTVLANPHIPAELAVDAVTHGGLRLSEERLAALIDRADPEQLVAVTGGHAPNGDAATVQAMAHALTKVTYRPELDDAIVTLASTAGAHQLLHALQRGWDVPDGLVAQLASRITLRADHLFGEVDHAITRLASVLDLRTLPLTARTVASEIVSELAALAVTGHGPSMVQLEALRDRKDELPHGTSLLQIASRGLERLVRRADDTVPLTCDGLELLASLATVDTAGSGRLPPYRLRPLAAQLRKLGWDGPLPDALADGELTGATVTPERFAELYADDPVRTSELVRDAADFERLVDHALPGADREQDPFAKQAAARLGTALADASDALFERAAPAVDRHGVLAALTGRLCRDGQHDPVRAARRLRLLLDGTDSSLRRERHDPVELTLELLHAIADELADVTTSGWLTDRLVDALVGEIDGVVADELLFTRCAHIAAVVSELRWSLGSRRGGRDQDRVRAAAARLVPLSELGEQSAVELVLHRFGGRNLDPATCELVVTLLAGWDETAEALVATVDGLHAA